MPHNKHETRRRIKRHMIRRKKEDPPPSPRKTPSNYRHISINPFLNDCDTNDTVERKTNESCVCAACKKKFSKHNNMLMECEFCASHYCITCIDMTFIQYKCMQRPDCLWRCFDFTVTKDEGPATQWLNTIMKTLNAKFENINEQLAKQSKFNEEKNEEFIKKFYQKLQALENKIETKLAIFPHKLQKYQTKWQKMRKFILATTADHWSKGHHSRREWKGAKRNGRQKSREQNLIIYRSVESTEMDN